MNPLTQPDRADRESAVAQTREFFKLLRFSRSKTKLVIFSSLIVFIIILNAIAQVRLNTWQGDFYNSISNRQLDIFYRQIWIYGILIVILLSLGVAQTWLHEMMKVKMRAALAFDLLEEWLRPKRAYRLPLVGEIGQHPDQRIQDDARRLTELSVDFAVGLVQSTLMLVSFIGVLWVLSDRVVFVLDGSSFSIPGYMVWAAIIYALIGSYITYLVGEPLIKANTDLRAAEAEFRFSLVRVDEYSEAITIYRGEEDEQRRLGNVAGNVFAVMERIANRIATLHWVTGGYGWIALIAPVLLAAPGYFSGSLSFGELMMVIGAFFQVQTSLRWYVDHFPALAEWRATLIRVISYRTVLTELETLGRSRSKVTYTDHPEGGLSFDDLEVFAPNGRVFVAEGDLEVAPGERVLISGPPRIGKSTFFRALAGLWIWGKGTLKLPKRGTLMFMPHRPYIPLGTLREAVTYPAPPDQFGDDAVQAALRRVRLEGRLPALDRARRWDQELTPDEQQRVALARVLLHKPDWLIQDETMSELDDESQELAESIFKHDLAKTTLISIGKKGEDDGFYDRQVNLDAKPPGIKLPLRLAEEPA